MHIYLKNNPAKFHPDPIWAFLKSVQQQENEHEWHDE